MEHAEIFWALFGVDMDRVLSEQPPDTWDSFPLFQILNDYLRTDGKFSKCHIFFLKDVTYCYFERKIFFICKLAKCIPCSNCITTITNKGVISKYTLIHQDQEVVPN